MKLLRIEYKKIVGNKSFKVFSILFLVFLPLLVILVPGLFGDNINGIEFYPLVPNNYETTWYAVSIISSWFSFFLLSFVLIYHITNEYNYRTVRQNIIDGYTRNEYILGKLYLMIAIALVATVYVFIVGLAGGIYFSSFEPKDPNFIQQMFNLGEEVKVEITGFGNVFDGIANIFRFFIQVLANFSFAFFVAFLAKRGILAVLIYYASYIAEIIIGSQFRANNAAIIYDYMPLNLFSKILPSPGFMNIIRGISSPSSIDWVTVGIALLYSGLFIYFAKVLFFKRDIT